MNEEAPPESSTSLAPVRRDRQGKDLSPEAVKARFAELNLVPAHEKQEIHELPAWVKLALVERSLESLTYDDAAKRFKKTGGTLQNYAQSPAAKKWLEDLQPFLTDPIAMAKAILGSSAANIALNRLVSYHALHEAGQHEDADKIARDLMDRMGIVAKKADANAPLTLKINLQGGSFGGPVIEAEYEVVDKPKRDDV